METIWSIPVAVLLLAAVLIFVINRGKGNIGAAWMTAIGAGLFVWGWTIALYFRPDVQIIPIAESIPGILEEEGIFRSGGMGSFILDGISYPYMLSVSALLVILMLTAPSYMDAQTAPRLWFFFLLIVAVGYLSVSTNNLMYVIYGWVLFDVIDLVAQYLQSRPNGIRRGVLTAIGIRFAGTLLAAASLALSYSELGKDSGAFISLRGGAFLLTACALRMGIVPISQPYTEMSASRVGLGTVLRSVSILTVMPILSRVPLGALSPAQRFVLGLAGAIAALAGAVGWLLSGNAFSGVSYADLAVCGMALNCALSRQQAPLVVWGVSVALCCAPLSLFQIQNRFMNLLGFLIVLCFSGLPFTPNAIGWTGLVSSPNPVQNVLYILIPLILMGGALIHILRTEGRKFTDLEPWMRSIYPLGFFAAIGTHVFIGMTEYGEMFSIGVLPASIIAFVGGIWLAVFFVYLPEERQTANAVAWGRAGMSLFWRGMRTLMDMDWLISFGSKLTKFLRWMVNTISTLLEHNGGLIWEFLLLALLIAASFGGVL